MVNKMIHIFMVGVIGYLLSVLLVFIIQRKLLFFPKKEAPTKSGVFIPNISEVFIETKDGLKLVSWFVPPMDNKPVIVHFHGNAGSINGAGAKLQQLAHRGYGFLFVEYRGYSGNQGKPSEKAFINDALDAINYLKQKNYDASQLVLYGESIGSGVAVAVAKEINPKALILEAPFYSVLSVAQESYWYFPVSLMIKDPFRNDLKITDVKTPVLFIHGKQDDIVDVEHSKKLFAIANEPKELQIVEKAGHNNLFIYGLIDIVDNWLKKR